MASGFPTANFSDSEEGLFSPQEIQKLMRIEYDRAQRYSYAMVLMLVEVDRLEYLHDLYGYDSKEEILHAVLGQLQGLTRESDFLGCMQNERILTAFPHTPEQAAGRIAGRLLQGSRDLQFESGGRGIRITLSVGIAVSDPDRVLPFEEFQAEAHDALMFAIRAGGDRYVRREPATHLIESLRQKLEEEAEALREEQDRERASTEFTIVPQAHLGEVDGGNVGEMGSLAELDLPAADDEAGLAQVRALFGELEARPQEIMLLERELLTLIRSLLAGARAAAGSNIAQGHRGQVDVLERRIAKLKDVLDQTEANLRSVAAAKEVDPGVASIYRSVQGLSGGEEGFGRKKEMLTILFEANQDLRRDIRKQAKGKPPTGEK